MPNPTCPHCNQPIQATDETFLLGDTVVIVLDCECGKSIQLSFIPASRFEEFNPTVGEIVAALLAMALPFI